MKEKNIKIVGIDEVGRGSLAGPIVAALVSLKIPFKEIQKEFNFKITDSKKMSPKNRLKVFNYLSNNNSKIIFKFISARKINKIGIQKSNLLVIRNLLKNYETNPNETIIIDGNLKISMRKQFNQKYISLIAADKLINEVSLASIVAKVKRDKFMAKLALIYPKYEFDKHKGYGTKKHIENIYKFGICNEHRINFVKTALNNYNNKLCFY